MSFFGNINGGSGGSGGASSRSSTYTVANISERDALLAVNNGAICLVQDASSDSNVISGFAVYQRLGSNWLKISDEGIMKFKDTESVQETENKRFVTTQEKELISETKLLVDGIETILDKSSLIQASPIAPEDTKNLWLEQ